MKKMFSALFMLIALAGCGQSGALYLPDPAQANQPQGNGNGQAQADTPEIPDGQQPTEAEGH